MSDVRIHNDGWLDFDLHGRVGIRVAAGTPAAAQLRTMLACFATEHPVPGDIVVTEDLEAYPEAAELEDELRYTPRSLELVPEGVQVVRDGDRFAIHGSGELLTTLVPVMDRAMVRQRAAMFHAATVAYRGHAIALPAGGGTGKTSTVAKLMRQDGFSFMGDDWAFLADDGGVLGYEKPMFIKPHHRPIYPHLFQGARKPLLPVALSRPVGRLTTGVHPWFTRHPALAARARRWSPEHRTVRAADALPHVAVTRSAPLHLAVYVERHGGSTPRLTEVDTAWLVDRMLGNFHIEMARFSQAVVTAMAATSMLSWSEYVDDKREVLAKGLDGIPAYLLQVPGRHSADQASGEVVAAVMDLLELHPVPEVTP